MAEWRDVPGWEGLYEVSDEGKVRSLREGRYHMKEKVPTLVLGYLKVGLYQKPRHQMLSVHRIVAEVFVPNPDNKPFVNHINGIKTDNRKENLEWVTAQENTNHAIRMGLFEPKMQPRRRPLLVLDKSTGDVKRFISASDAARHLGLDQSEVVRQANKNEGYKDCKISKYFFLYDPKGDANGKEVSEH
jgi:hypothetical protein